MGKRQGGKSRVQGTTDEAALGQWLEVGATEEGIERTEQGEAEGVS